VIVRNRFAEEIETLDAVANAVGSKLDVNDQQDLAEGGKLIRQIILSREYLEAAGNCRLTPLEKLGSLLTAMYRAVW
jgi:hypothetical protein